MSLNHSSVNRVSFAVVPLAVVCGVFMFKSASTLGVIFKNLFNSCLRNNLKQTSYIILAVTGIVLLFYFVSSKFRFPGDI